MCLALWFKADSGFSGADEAVDPSSLPPEDRCESNVTLSLFVSPEGARPAWSSIWDNIDFDAKTEMQKLEWRSEENGMIHYVWQELSLSEFKNEATVRDKIGAFIAGAASILEVSPTIPRR